MSVQFEPVRAVVSFKPHQFIQMAQEAIFRIQEGWACHYALLPDGRRQIISLYLPGDICDPRWIIGSDQPKEVLTLTTIKAIPLSNRLAGGSDAQEREFWRALSMVERRQQRWLLTLGRRSAGERIAYLFLEIHERMRRAGLAYGQQCAFNLTQTEIADLTGLTSVHVNRTIQGMRARGQVELEGRWLRIPDPDLLRQVAALRAGDLIE
ncbi:Crp/Fnr family transcriptional regulator [Sphingobium sp. BHU LFT2]|nr:Crp/Fnr family transcriptional regulator [Sphingobium sp. BHU LFT2]